MEPGAPARDADGREPTEARGRPDPRRGARALAALDARRAADGAAAASSRRSRPRAARNVNTWPVLATAADDTVLGAAILLPDHPQLAPESRGALFDGTEIEEALLLHVHALSDAEREEIAQQDAAVREMVERALTSTPEDIVRSARQLRPVPAGSDRDPRRRAEARSTARPSARRPAAPARRAHRPLRPDARRAHRDARADLRRLRRTRPSRGHGRQRPMQDSCARPAATSSSSRTRWSSSRATKEETDERERRSAEDNPPRRRGREGPRQRDGRRARRPGRRDRDARARGEVGIRTGGSGRVRPNAAGGAVEEDPTRRGRVARREETSRRATKQVLVAAVGNLWLRDDGFGGEVASGCRSASSRTASTSIDFGTGGLDLAYEVMRGYDALGARRRQPTGRRAGHALRDGGRRRTSVEGGIEDGDVIDPHAMDPQTVLRFVKTVGGWPGQGDGRRLRAGGGRGDGHRPERRRSQAAVDRAVALVGRRSPR